MKMKKIFGFLIVLLAVMVAFVGCGIFDDDTGYNGSDSGSSNNNYTPDRNNYYTIKVYNEYDTLVTMNEWASASGNTLTPPTVPNGRSFLGFYTSDNVCYFDETGRQLDGLVLNNDIILYYKWSDELCTIHFDAGEGTMPAGDTETYEIQYNSSVTSLPVPEKEGFAFRGWKNANGEFLSDENGVPTGSAAKFGSAYLINSEKVASLRAEYAIRQFTVTLEYQDSSIPSVTQTINWGGTVTGLPVRDLGTGYKCFGWSTNRYAKSSDELITSYGPVTEDVTLYGVCAHYKFINLIYTDRNYERVMLCEDAGAYIFPVGEEPVARNPGFDCTGWYTDRSLAGSTKVDRAYFNDVADTFYASWAEATYTLTFKDEDGASYMRGSYDREYSIDSETIELPSVEERDEYEFLGWTTDDEKIFKDGVIPTGTYGSLVLKPLWREYTTEFILFMDGRVVEEQSIRYNRIFTLSVPTMEGENQFAYWYRMDGDEIVRLTDATGASLEIWKEKGGSINVFCEYLSMNIVTIQYEDPKTGEMCVFEEKKALEGNTVTVLSPTELTQQYMIRGYAVNNVQQTEDLIYTFEMPDHPVTVTILYTPQTANFTLNGVEVYKFNNRCYAPITQTKTWASAEAFCELYGGHLVTITSEEENEFVKRMVRKNLPSGGYCWIGATDKDEEGTWTWVTGEAFTFSYWSSGEPNDSSGNEDYAHFYNNETCYWNDIPGSNSYAFICEWESEQSASVVMKTLTDSNGDRVTFELVKYNGHYYSPVSDTTKDWVTAERYAESLGGHLVTITNAEENAFVNSLRLNARLGNASIGWTDYFSEGNWEWVTGEDASYKNWASGQPDNYNNEDFGHFYTDAGQWNDSTGGNYTFIIEWESFSDIGTAKLLYMGGVIRTADDLKKLAKSFSSSVFTLEADINMAGVAWTPCDFRGTLDGKGHKIIGYSLNTGDTNCCFFKTVTGTIKDVVFEDLSLTSTVTGTSSSYCGVIQYLQGGTVDGIEITSGAINAGTSETGGICALVDGTSYIRNCINRATILCSNSNTTYSPAGTTGGIIGWISGGTPTVEHCINYGAITGTCEVGGLIGGSAVVLTIKDSQNHGKINGKYYVGGLIGCPRKSVTIDGGFTVGSLITALGYYGKYAGGPGTTTCKNIDVVSISSAKELEYLIGAMSAESFELTADVDMTDVPWASCAFAGSFDGKGHTISGLTEPLFSALSGTVQSLCLDSAITRESQSGEYIGAVCCVAKNGAVVSDVRVSGVVSPVNSQNIGGLVGCIEESATVKIEKCVNDSDVLLELKEMSIGGIVGYIYKKATVTFEGNVNNGIVSNPLYNTAGMIGAMQSSVTLKDCINNGAITGANCVAGLVGYANGCTATIDHCQSLGTITGENWKKYVGGGGDAYQNLDIMKISKSDELRYLMNAVAAETFEIIEDMDLTGVPWTSYAFSGTLDGKYHTISGLTEPLFATLSGSVKSLRLHVAIAGDDRGNQYIGAVCGVAKNGASLSEVQVGGSITPAIAGNTAGLIGSIDTSSTVSITKCVNNATITMNRENVSIGGLVGFIYNGCTVTFEENTNNGAVSNSLYNAGGLIGGTRSAVTLKNCVNKGAISGAHSIGGLVGYADGVTMTIDACGSLGTITGENWKKYVGNDKAVYQNFAPTVIKEAANLRYLEKAVSAETFELGADLDMTGVAWTTIDFAATLDGKGHSIKNLTLSSASGDLAMFATLSGTVKDLVFENASVTSTSYTKVSIAVLAVASTGTVTNVIVRSGAVVGELCDAAGVVAHALGGTIENCKNYAEISGTTSATDGGTGGIVEYLKGASVIGCTNYGKVSGKRYVGGVVADIESGTVDDCKNVGAVSGSDRTGGVIANFRAGTATNLTNEGAVTGGGSYTGGVIGCVTYGGDMTFNTPFLNTGKITGKDYTGGVVGYFYDHRDMGYNDCRHTVTISKWTNKGDIVGEKYVGGVIGWIEASATHSGSHTSLIKLTADTLANEANVTGTSYVGGLIGCGSSNDSSSVIEGSTSKGEITAEYIVGGLFGKLSSILVSACSNEGSAVTATSYQTEGTTYHAYLGGYLGIGYAVKDCDNAVDITYTDRGDCVGGIAGYLNTGSLNNCNNTGAILATKANNVGGIVGSINCGGTYTMNLLSNAQAVSGASRVGGIIGYVKDYRNMEYNDCNHTFTINKSTNTGAISASASYAGGIIGYGTFSADHSGSHTSVIAFNATVLKNEGNVTAQESYAGGLIGYVYSNYNTSFIKDSSSKGAITSGYYVGGLAGQLSNIKLTDSSNAGTTVAATGYQTAVVNNVTKFYAYLGGYCGCGYYVENCENAVDITYTERGSYVGGIVGYQSAGGMSDCKNSGDIVASDAIAVGGLIGYANSAGDVTYKNLENSGSVTGRSEVGGVLGFVKDYREMGYGDCDNTVTMEKLTNSGAVSGETHIGGIVGYAEASATHNGSHMSVIKILAQKPENSGAVTGSGDYVGGIFGYAYSNNPASRIIDPTVTDTVSCTGTGTNVGKIYGMISNITVVQ